MAREQVIVAIDPGASGGWAWEIKDFGEACENMPPSPHEMTELVYRLQSEGCVRAFVEEVGGYAGGPGAPGSRMFNFGRNFGEILGVLAACGVAVELVKPAKWQKALGLGTSKGMSRTQWKNKLKLRAQQLYPNQRVTLAVADALLILHAATKELI